VSTASEITRKAKSNLAFALQILPKDRRDDMTVFYAFCRTVDDIADDTSVPKTERSKALKAWEDGLRNGFPEGNDFGAEVAEMTGRRGIPVEWLLEIIEGCGMDLEVPSFQGWEELSRYNWKVAGVLGNALQLTNILRDVGEDLANGGRIYLPVNDMIRFQYSERDLVGKVYDGRFLAMMGYQAERAEHLFAEAESLIPGVDRRALVPAQIMSEIYRNLLKKMKAGKFKVFDRRYSVSKTKKLAILSKYLLALRRAG
jgi:phytoene synthase